MRKNINNINKNKYFGLVEGFFSRPLPQWTLKERTGIIQFCGKRKNFNTYMYCPKDDPYVTKKWDELYPQNFFANIKESNDICLKNKITFCYGINPFIDIDLQQGTKAYKKVVSLIIAKIEQVLNIGIRDICILFDDIPYAYDVTANVKSKRDASIGKLQTTIANEVFRYFGNRLNSKWFCPSDYFFMKETPYISEIKNLDPAIIILWTGKRIFVPTITLQEIKTVKRILGRKRKIVWWDNYPVNDCFYPLGWFHVGVFNIPDSGVLDLIDGILVNPMREAYANYPTLASFLSWIKFPISKISDRGYSLEKAFSEITSSKEFSGCLKRIYETFSDRSIVDSTPQGYFLEILNSNNSKDILNTISDIENDLKEIQNRKSNKKVDQFLNATQETLNKAWLFIDIVKKINNKSKWIDQWKKMDVFPLVLNKGDYIKKSYSILKNRLSYTESIGEKILNKKELEKMYIKFQNVNSLKFNKNEVFNWYKELKKLVRQDQNIFLLEINKMNPIDSIKSIIRRRQIHPQSD